MRHTYACGFDFGNSESCLVLYDRSRTLSMSIPSRTALGTLEELTNLGVPLVAGRDFVYRDASTELYIGELALSQASLSFSGRDDISRYWSKKSRQLLATLAAHLVGEPEFDLHVVTGLPVATYASGPEAREQVKEALSGEHHFSVNGTAYRVGIHVERVIMEGAGAAIEYGVAQGLQGVIDPGGRTTDLYVADGQKPLRHLCRGEKLGVELAADLLSRTFERKYGRPLSPSETRQMLHAYVSGGMRPFPVLYAKRGQVPDQALLVRDALSAIGSDIASFVAATWNEGEAGQVAQRFARVLLIGGGAYYFEGALRRVIPHLTLVERPEEANALGYAAFAARTLARSASNIA